MNNAALRLIGWWGLLLIPGAVLAAEPPVGPPSRAPVYVPAYVKAPFDGRVLDAQTGKPIAGAFVLLAWWAREGDGAAVSSAPRPLYFVRHAQTNWYGYYHFPNWAPGNAARPGWDLKQGLDAVLRIYVSGYRRLELQDRPMESNSSAAADYRFPWQGAALKLIKLPGTKDALLTELSTWRADIEAGYMAHNGVIDKQIARDNLEPLLYLFNQNCQQLSPTERESICFPPSSELGANTGRMKIIRPGDPKTGEEPTIIRRPGLDGGAFSRPSP